MLDSSGRKIIYIDASSLKESGCLRKFYWSSIKGYSSGKESSDTKIQYGSAIHLGLESWYKGEEVKDCVVRAIKHYEPFTENLSEKDFRTVDHLYRTLTGYFRQYPREGDNIVPLSKEHIELKFSIPFWQNDEYVIVLCGTIDMKATYAGMKIIVDHKSTSANNAEFYFSDYDLNIQVMFYSWLDKQISGESSYLPVLVNGIFIKKPTIKAQEKGEFDGVTFQRSTVITFSNEQMAQFEYWLNSKISYIIQGLENGDTDNYFHYSFDLAFCKTPFGVCKYFNVCRVPMELQAASIEANYKIEEYNPLKWRE